MGRAIAVLIALVVVAAIAALRAGGHLAVDALWFAEVGALVVFRTVLLTKLACFAIAFAAVWAFVAAVELAALQPARTRGPLRIVRHDGERPGSLPELLEAVADRVPWRGLAVAAAAAVALLIAGVQTANWRTFLLWRHGGAFGVADPLFGRDVGFYVFTLPAYRALVDGAEMVVVLAAVLAGVLFRVQGLLDARAPAAALPPAGWRLLSVLLAAFLLTKGAGYWLDRWELLLAPSGAVFGAGYTAAHVTLPLLWAQAGGAVAGAVLALANVRQPGWRLPLGAVLLVFGTAIAATIVPGVFQRLRVRPDELRLERPYLAHNIAMTRRAYGLDLVRRRPFPATQALDQAAVDRNRATFANVRLWNPKPLHDSYHQLQSFRLYYEFNDIDVDRYDLGDGPLQVMLSAREIDASLLPSNAQTWVNQRLQFTHGFGIVMNPVSAVEGEGLPHFVVKDIPPRMPPALPLTEPRIYFGERTDDYVVVDAAADEFDHPKGEQNVTNRYAGAGGVGIGSWLRRALFAWSFGDVNLLVSANLHSESRILFRRAVAERVATIAPFLRLDRDPYVVVAGGRLYWLLDAYTTATTFPYAEPVRGTGLDYIRNAVKAVVDAYDGTVTLYAIDENEPVLAAYAHAFPGLFRPIAEMPEELRKHIRYPEDLFLIQNEVYRTYHMTEPDVFYNKEDLWSFPTDNAGGERQVVEPYYVVMKLPGAADEEFILMQPMTPSNRGNMVAWIAARCDPAHYGELVEFEFPKDRLIYGPQQIEARIDQDTTISQALSLWNQMGSKVIRGSLLVIPVEDAVVYVEPLYLRSDQGQIPELKRVIVAYDDRLAMEPTLDGALAKVFGGGTAAVRGTAPPEPSEAPRDAGAAREHYRAAIEALRGGDWGGFGREMDALGKALAP